MKITKSVVINKPAAQLWKIIGEDFDKAALWMGPIPKSVALNAGHSSIGAPMEGRICDLSNNPNGAKAKEVLTEYDPANMRLTFDISSINVPAIVPVKKNTVTMFITAIDANSCKVSWTARPQLKTPAYLFYPLLRMMIPFAFANLLKGLKTYAEGLPLQNASA